MQISVQILQKSFLRKLSRALVVCCAPCRKSLVTSCNISRRRIILSKFINHNIFCSIVSYGSIVVKYSLIFSQCAMASWSNYEIVNLSSMDLDRFLVLTVLSFIMNTTRLVREYLIFSIMFFFSIFIAFNLIE